MPNYETVFIVKPELPDDKCGALLEKVKGIISSCDGNIILTDNWGRRRLAYQIGKNKEGNYFLLQFSAKPLVCSEIEKYFRTSDDVIRHIMIKNVKTFKKKSEKKEAAAVTGADATAAVAPQPAAPVAAQPPTEPAK
jgi:small subunit ribosomal protein S6